MTPPWSGSSLPAPTSMARTTRVLASELEESTRILRKSVGIWPQNIDLFEGLSICSDSVKLWWDVVGK